MSQIVYGCRGVGKYEEIDNEGVISYTDTSLGSVKKDGVEVTVDRTILKIEAADVPTVVKALTTATDAMVKCVFINATLEQLRTQLGLPVSAIVTAEGKTTLTIKAADVGTEADFSLYVKTLCDDGFVRTYRFPRVAPVGNISIKHGRDEAAEIPAEFQVLADASGNLVYVIEE